MLHGIMLARFGDEWRDEVARRLLEDSGGLTGGIALDFSANRIGRVARDTSDFERTAVDAADVPQVRMMHTGASGLPASRSQRVGERCSARSASS